MKMSRQSSQAGGWTVSAQSVSMAASIVAIIVAVAKPIGYVSDLRVAVERLVEATARIDSATQRQEERLRAVERRDAGVAELLEGVRASREERPVGKGPGCPGAESSR